MYQQSDNYIWKCYLLLVVLLPLPFGLNREWAWPIAGGIILCLLGLKTFQLFQTKIYHQLPQIQLVHPFKKALPLLFILIIVQMFVAAQLLTETTLSPYDTHLSLFKGISYTSMFALTLLLLDTKHRMESLVWALVVSASIQAFYGVVMVLSEVEWGFFIEKSYFRNTATGTFINRNHLAGYLEMTVAMGIGLILSSSTRYEGSFRNRFHTFLQSIASRKLLLRLLIIIAVIGLIMTRSRMGNTAFFSSLLITGFLGLILMKHKARSTSLLLASLLVIDVMIIGAFFGVDAVVNRLESTNSEVESRDEVAISTLKQIYKTPLTGIGAGAFTHSFPTFKDQDVITTKIYNNTHNDYAQFAVEYGLICFSLLLVVVVVPFWWSVTSMYRRNNPFHQGIGFGSTMALIAIAAHSLVDFNLQIPANALTFMIILAFAVNARWGNYKATHK